MSLTKLIQVANSEGVIPAQFDWNKSGLTNPLAENGKFLKDNLYHCQIIDINFSIYCSGVHLSLLDIEFFANASLETNKNRPQHSKFYLQTLLFSTFYLFFSRESSLKALLSRYQCLVASLHQVLLFYRQWPLFTFLL